jgi:hypothetical protein
MKGILGEWSIWPIHCQTCKALKDYFITLFWTRKGDKFDQKWFCNTLIIAF